MMTAENTDDVVVFRTGRRNEIDLATQALQKAGIPCFTQQEPAAGPLEAIPEPWLGIWWSVHVPHDAEGKAQKILAELPFEIHTTPEVWDLMPPQNVKRSWGVFAIGMTLILLVWLIKALLV